MISSAFETYQKIIQHFLSTGSDYERNKASIGTQFQREKETTESDLKKTTTVAQDTLNNATTTAESNLKNAIAFAEREQSNAKNAANKVIATVRNSMKAAQNIINQNKWNKKIQGGIPDHITTASASIAQQLDAHCRIVVAASEKIKTTTSSYASVESESKIIIATVAAFIINIFILIFLLDFLSLNNSASLIIFLFTFTFTFIVIYRVIGIKRDNKFRILKNAHATLVESASMADKLYKQQVETAQRTHQQQVETAQWTHQQQIETAQRTHQQQTTSAQRTYQQKLADLQTSHTEKIGLLNQKLARNIAEIKNSSNALISEVGLPGINWDDPQWEQWQPFSSISSVARVGTLSTNVHKNMPSLPALVACPGHQNILFKASGASKDIAIEAIQSLMLRLLAAQPPGKVQFTLIDPIGLGQNVASFMQLARHNEDLIGSRAWSETKDIDQRLANLSEQMSIIIQKRLLGQYKTIEEYNKAAGEIAEPYRVLVVVGFPAKFSQEAAGRIIEIAINGPKCGVSTIIMWDTEQPSPYGFSSSDLERASTVIAWNGQRFVWQARKEEQNKDIEKCQLTLDTPPPLEVLNHILKLVGEKSKVEVKVSFERIILPPAEWWTGNTREIVKVPLGQADATELQYMELGEGTSVHALIAGQTRSGKTNLLHVLITTLSLKYSPDELEFHLVDFKQVGFAPFAAAKLPHARVIAIESEREFCLSVLQGLNNELERRKNIFRMAGVPDITEYRKVQPNVRMPRMLLVVDEFHEFFVVDDKINQDATLFLDRLVRQGGAFGIHVLLCSQTLAGSYTLPRATIGQMAIRIALKSSDADARIVLSDENAAARLLSRQGEAIYNAKNGLVEGNNSFQTAYLPDEKLDSYLERIQKFAQQTQRKFSPEWEQIVFNGRELANLEKNKLLKAALSSPSWPVQQKNVTVWLGDPIAIKDPSSIHFHSLAGNNLLIVGQQEETALGMLITTIFSLAAQYTPSGARFYIVDFNNTDMLGQIAQSLLHKVKVVNRRGLLSAITEIADEVDERMEKEETATEAIYLIFYGLQRARDLRSDDDFMSSSYGVGDTSPSPSKRFATILREGPEFGVHTIGWCDTFTNLNRTLERGMLREFEMRVAFQMSQEDSINFLNSPAASQFGEEFSQYRAALYSEETNRLEKFRPYGLPSSQWIQNAAYQIRQKRPGT